MQKQVTAVVDGSKAQNFLSTMNFLQQEAYRMARQKIIGSMNKDFLEWTDEEKTAASLVCSSYDTLAILVKMGLVPKEVVVREWGPSIVRTHDILSDFMSGYRANMGNHYWDDFPWLASEVKIAQG